MKSAQSSTRAFRLSRRRRLHHLAILKGIAPKEAKDVVDELLMQTNLWDARQKKLGTYSGGMKQRFGIAQALLGDPKLIIVDEPTAGLDPAERLRFLNLLSEIGEDRIVILSTHIVEDVSELCRQMAVISKGRVQLEADPAAAEYDAEAAAALERQFSVRDVGVEQRLVARGEGQGHHPRNVFEVALREPIARLEVQDLPGDPCGTLRGVEADDAVDAVKV